MGNVIHRIRLDAGICRSQLTRGPKRNHKNAQRAWDGDDAVSPCGLGGLHGVQGLGQGRVRFGTQRSDLKSSQTAPAQGQGFPQRPALASSGSRAPSSKAGQAGPANSPSRPGYTLHICELVSERPFPLRTTLNQVLILPKEPGVAALPRCLQEGGGASSKRDKLYPQGIFRLAHQRIHETPSLNSSN